MATSDGESCSAEDRALKDWEDQPWEDETPWAPLERVTELSRQAFVKCYEEAFRAGFRAGQEASRAEVELQPAPTGIVERELRGYIQEIHDRIDSVTDHLNGVIQRVEKLEAHPERLGSSEKHIDRRVESLEAWRQFSVKQLDAIEAKLRLLEPIG